MPLFTQTLFLRKPTETEQLEQEDYNFNMDLLDDALDQHESNTQAHGLDTVRSAAAAHVQDLSAHGRDFSFYKLDKDSTGVFTQLQWKRADGTLARKVVLSEGTPPEYTLKTVTDYQEDGITVKEQKEYTLTYDDDHDLVSEVLR
jgi:hypothetical protein